MIPVSWKLNKSNHLPLILKVNKYEIVFLLKRHISMFFKKAPSDSSERVCYECNKKTDFFQVFSVNERMDARFMYFYMTDVHLFRAVGTFPRPCFPCVVPQ